MVTKSAPESKTNKALNKDIPLSLPYATKGIKTGEDFANMMSAMMSDIIEARITPAMANAACNAGGKLLKIVEMQYKYSAEVTGAHRRSEFLLAPGMKRNDHPN